VVYPKVLIVSEIPFCLGNGMGITLSTFFKGWPKENLIQLYASTWRFELRNDVYNRKINVSVTGHKGRRYIIPFMLGLNSAWRGYYSERWLKKRLGNWRPDMVYSFVFFVSTLKYADWVSSKLECPHMLSISDIIPEELGSTDKDTIDTIKGIFSRGRVRLAISQEMQEELQKQYDIDFEVLHNGAAEELFLSPETKPLSSGRLTIRFLGGIDKYRHFNAIEDVVEAVKEYNRIKGPILFEIFGGAECWKDNILSLINGKEIVFGGAPSLTEGYELLKTADLLVIPVTFDKSVFDSIRLSFPTKLPEYLASGTPTLIYGPRGTATTEYCIKNNLGILQTERSVSNLVNLFAKIVTDRNSFRQKALRDQAFIRENCSAVTVRTHFYNFIKKTLA
jgi:hypothetical protein